MAILRKEKESIKSGSGRGRGSLLWILWVVLGVLVISVIGFLVWRAGNQYAFVLQQGQKDLLVLIREDGQGDYRVKFEGPESVHMKSLHVMLAGQILHVDVKQVTLVFGDQEIVLEPNGSLPAGTDLNLKPGDTFTVHVTFLGQSLGGNYVYGFRIVYETNNNEQTYDLVMNYDYSVVVR